MAPRDRLFARETSQSESLILPAPAVALLFYPSVLPLSRLFFRFIHTCSPSLFIITNIQSDCLLYYTVCGYRPAPGLQPEPFVNVNNSSGAKIYSAKKEEYSRLLLGI